MAIQPDCMYSSSHDTMIISTLGVKSCLLIAIAAITHLDHHRVYGASELEASLLEHEYTGVVDAGACDEGNGETSSECGYSKCSMYASGTTHLA